MLMCACHSVPDALCCCPASASPSSVRIAVAPADICFATSVGIRRVNLLKRVHGPALVLRQHERVIKGMLAATVSANGNASLTLQSN